MTLWMLLDYLMPRAGLEPARPEGRGILSPLRLPIPPPGRDKRNVAATRQRLNASWLDRRQSAATRATAQAVRTELLQLLTEAFFQREILGPLKRREESRKFFLLRLE
jgi:hypothetical protein